MKEVCCDGCLTTMVGKIFGMAWGRSKEQVNIRTSYISFALKDPPSHSKSANDRWSKAAAKDSLSWEGGEMTAGGGFGMNECMYDQRIQSRTEDQLHRQFSSVQFFLFSLSRGPTFRSGHVQMGQSCLA